MRNESEPVLAKMTGQSCEKWRRPIVNVGHSVMMVAILYMRSNLSLEALYPKLYKWYSSESKNS